MARFEDDDRDDRDSWDAADQPEERGEELRKKAAAKTATPGLILMLTAIVLMILSLVGIAVVASGFDAEVEMLEYFESIQPPGQAKENFKKQIEEAKKKDKTFGLIVNVISTVLGLIFEFLMLLGAMKMRQVKGYGLAMTGAICALIPLNSCCCLAMPVGLWALVVLLNEDVKAGFNASKLD